MFNFEFLKIWYCKPELRFYDAIEKNVSDEKVSFWIFFFVEKVKLVAYWTSWKVAQSSSTGEVTLNTFRTQSTWRLVFRSGGKVEGINILYTVQTFIEIDNLEMDLQVYTTFI